MFFIVAAICALCSEAKFYKVGGFDPFINYCSEKPITEGDAETELGVIIVHGWGNGVRHNVYGDVAKELAKRGAKARIVAPLFPREALMKKFRMKPDGRALWSDSWEGSESKSCANDWRAGGDAFGSEISSLDVIDELIKTFSDEKLYPSMKRIVVSGFSAGGQLVGRYIAVGRCPVRKGVKLEFAVIAPAYELLFDKETPWHYGLKGRPRYPARLSDKEIYANLSRHRVWRGCGTLDNKISKSTNNVWAVRQGTSRYNRFRNFEKYIKAFPEWNEKVTFHDMPGAGHATVQVYRDKGLLDFIAGRQK